MESLQKRFTEMLTEISKVSAMKATTSLSKLLNTPCGVNFMPIEISSSEKIQLANITYPQTVSLCSIIKSTTLNGCAFLLTSQSSSLAMCNDLLHISQEKTKNINEFEKSALLEIANIVIGNYLMAFVQSLLTGTLLHLPATYQLASAEAIQKSIREMIKDQFPNKNIIKITFGYQANNFSGFGFFIFEEEKLNTLLHQLLILVNQ